MDLNPSAHLSPRSLEAEHFPPQLSRRMFVRNSLGVGLGIAALAPSASAAFFGNESDPPAPLITGSGSARYRVEHDWLVPPKGIRFGDTHGLAQDANGRIYVSHSVHPESASRDAIVVFHRDGSFAGSFGSRFDGGGHGLDVRKEGEEEFLYHCDVHRRQLAKTTLDGRLIWETGAPLRARAGDAACYERETDWNPTNVAFGPDGALFVGDGYGKSFVHRFSQDGEWEATLATPGTRAGEVSCPHGLWVDDRFSEPRLAVADRSNRRIQYFSLDGKPLGFVTEGMRQPCHFKTRGDLLLVPDLASVVTILDRDHRVVAHLGDGDPTTLRGAPREQFIPGKFVHPHTAIWLDDGSILVAEWVPIGRITRLTPV